MVIYAGDKVLLMGQEEQIRADVTEGGKTNVWGNVMQEVYPCAGQKVLDHMHQSRGEERWLLSPAGTAACKRDPNPHPLQQNCVS